MSNLLRLDISGSDPAAHARRILEQYAEDDEVQSVTIEIESADKDTTANSTENTSLPGFTDEEDSEKDERVTEELEEANEVQRRKGKIQANTNHHRVLYTAAKLSNGRGVTSQEIQEHVVGVPKGSIRPALKDLWERRFVERERVSSVANPYYKYEITDYGNEQLKNLGKPEKED